MNVMGYAILEEEKIPHFLREKPRWVTCMAFAAAMLVITTVAITAGIFIGYTYCYLEHQSRVIRGKPGNLTRSTNLQIIHIPAQDTGENNKTVNGVYPPSFIISEILKISNVIKDEETPDAAEWVDDSQEPVP